jgi:hypothetical protein
MAARSACQRRSSIGLSDSFCGCGRTVEPDVEDAVVEWLQLLVHARRDVSRCVRADGRRQERYAVAEHERRRRVPKAVIGRLVPDGVCAFLKAYDCA